MKSSKREFSFFNNVDDYHSHRNKGAKKRKSKIIQTLKTFTSLEVKRI